MAVIESSDKKYSTLIDEIETGQIKIPQFQRQFVWDIEASAKLMDSILKGYPIGTFIYWRTKERLRSVRNIGNIELPEPLEGEFVNYVLDGQQRITSLFAALKGETIERESGKREDYSNIFIDFDADEEDMIVVTDTEAKPDHTYVRLTDLMNEGRRFFNQFDEKYDPLIDRYKEILQSYLFKGINLKQAEIDVATDVFTRLNVGGKALTLFEIMVAKTYDPKSGFDLHERYTELIEELQPLDYETISSTNILQFIALLLRRECKRKVILKLEKEEFINTWEDAVNCVKHAIDFFKSYGIPVSKLLPYNTLVVPFAYFFYHHPEPPTGNKLWLMEDFFWRVSLGGRYSSAVESKLVQDIDKVDKILREEHPNYEWSIDVSPDAIARNGWFRTSSAFITSILCLLSMQQPRSFDNNLRVRIDNSWLKVSTSKNYHHFFPIAFMKKHEPQREYGEYNHIANITIVDDFLNKRKIKARAPSDYMRSFQKDNQQLTETMNTHLIKDMDNFGIWDDDYSRFFEERIKLISEKLESKIIR